MAEGPPPEPKSWIRYCLIVMPRVAKILLFIIKIKITKYLKFMHVMVHINVNL